MAAETLPMDVIATEILSRLPVKSVLQFKCVCKFFKTLISTPEFIRRHLRHSLSSSDNRLLVLIGEIPGVYSFLLDSPKSHSVSLHFPREISWGFTRFSFIGSHNGLICIGMYRSLIIFNPSTAVYKLICCDDLSIADSCVNYGLGYDDITDDYKIVRLKAYTSNDVNDFGGTRRDIEVYSLKSDSWSLVERKCNQDIMKHMENGALIDNHLVHWMFWNPSTRKHRIGCFNLRNNLWADNVPLPDHCREIDINHHFVDVLFPTYRNEQNDLVKLGVFDGCLCLLTENFRSMAVDVWMMKEYGIKDPWMKLVSIQNRDVRQLLKICPFAYGRGSKDEILVRMDSHSAFFWYNITNKRWRSAEIYGASAYREACMCKESLVSIPGGVPFQVHVFKN